MFPDFLDGARVLEYTEMGHFGFITDYDENDVPFEKEICYLAVCRYDDTPEYYIFSCDSNFDVISDGCFRSIEICKTCHELSSTAIWHKK